MNVGWNHACQHISGVEGFVLKRLPLCDRWSRLSSNVGYQFYVHWFSANRARLSPIWGLSDTSGCSVTMCKKCNHRCWFTGKNMNCFTPSSWCKYKRQRNSQKGTNSVGVNLSLKLIIHCVCAFLDHKSILITHHCGNSLNEAFHGREMRSFSVN